MLNRIIKGKKYRVVNCYVIKNKLCFDVHVKEIKNFDNKNFILVWNKFETKHVKRPYIFRVWEERKKDDN